MEVSGVVDMDIFKSNTMNKLQKIILAVLGLSGIGFGIWYFTNKKNTDAIPKNNNQKVGQEEQEQSYSESENKQLTEKEKVLLEYDTDAIGTIYKLDFDNGNMIVQPIGFGSLFLDLRNGGFTKNFTAHGELVEKIDFLSKKDIRIVDKERLLEFFDHPNLINRIEYMDGDNLLDSATPNYPMLVRSVKTNRVYAVPTIQQAFGIYNNKKLLTK